MSFSDPKTPMISPSTMGQDGFLSEASGVRLPAYPMESTPRLGYDACRRRQTNFILLVPPLREGTTSFYPPELTCLEVIDDPDPEKTVAVMEVQNGHWGLSDPALQGSRYLITIEAPGLRVSPAGYVAVVFGGKAPHRLHGVDFCVGDPETPDCDTGPVLPEDPSTSAQTPTSSPVPAPTHTPTTIFSSTQKSTASPAVSPTPVEPAAREALENALKDPMVRIAERVPGFVGVFLDSTKNVVYTPPIL